MNGLEKLDKEFELKNLKLENDLLKEQTDTIEEHYFNDARSWDNKFIGIIKKVVTNVCEAEHMSSS